nr:MAG TPA: hypothetical protein [Caudoviricetes sp.]
MEKIGLITVRAYGIKQSRQFLAGRNQVRVRYLILCLIWATRFLLYLKHRCLIIGVEKPL